MSDIEIPFDGEAEDRAVVLLAAAEKLGHAPESVRTVTGGFMVSEDIAKEAGLAKAASKSETQVPSNAPVPNGNDEKQAPAKKAPAKKAAKKSPAKKSAAKKSTTKKQK
jgi:ABC-type uncharacterized transport system involved in gliding motility auxiliary subunit